MPKATCIESLASISTFSPCAPQVDFFGLENELVAHDNVKRPLLFPEDGVLDKTANKFGQITRSIARAKRIVIPESVTLSDSEDDGRKHLRQVRLVTYGASKTLATSNDFRLALMSSDVIVPLSVNVQEEQSRSPSTSVVQHRFGVRFKLNTNVAAASAFTPAQGDMCLLTTWSVGQT